MARVNKSKPILLTQDQMDALEKIQEQERKHSPYGASPSIPELVRGLLDRALADAEAKEAQQYRNSNALIRHQIKKNLEEE
ncbi:hypothetical protein BIY27_25680 [Gibbsiella quercinecans]|uniref:hypothetical protein n=1 Tax=Gibbsiella quercinecans TaxID=929813 RepID=UPI000EF246CA|nr:hypothetical protein [Gibbsiella quercinecans]RLM02136.1 hypothetical protein BIY27_25680 [Gibbsiella quercinecans]